MKRGPLLAIVLLIEVIVAIILIYNYRYLYNRLRTAAPVSSNPPTLERQTALTTASDTSSSQQSSLTTKNATSGALIPELTPALLSVFSPLPNYVQPTNYELSQELVALGRTLFYDPRLSADSVMSCNTCHPLDRFGADGLPVSIGHQGKPVKRNAQSVYNAALHISQFWDGRSPTVEDQAKGPILAEAEMGMLAPDEVEATLRSIPGYAPLFAAAFPGDPNPITFDHVAQSIGAFERLLLTPSRFDRFIVGDYSQLTAEEQHGVATFINLGCPTCHLGVTVGGLLYKKLGEIEPFSTDDVGRFNVTGLEEDRFVFKVPSLRNVTRTAPYMHDGKIQTLEEMIVIMARHQLGKQVTSEQITAVITFLHTLTGDIPMDYVAPPSLPQ